MPPLLLLGDITSDFLSFFESLSFREGSTVVVISVEVVDVVLAAFCVVVASFSSLVVAVEVSVRASTGAAVGTALDFFMVSRPFPLVPLALVIYSIIMGMRRVCCCRVPSILQDYLLSNFPRSRSILFNIKTLLLRPETL